MLLPQAICVTVTDEVKDRLVTLGYDAKLGARPLRRVLQDQIENQVADAFLQNPDLHHVHFALDDQEDIVIDQVSNEAALLPAKQEGPSEEKETSPSDQED